MSVKTLELYLISHISTNSVTWLIQTTIIYKYRVKYLYSPFYSSIDYQISPEESLSYAVIQAVSSVQNRIPEDLPPLYKAIDPDALDNLLASIADKDSDLRGHISFFYCNCKIPINDN
jgi:hypothetical protein